MTKKRLYRTLKDCAPQALRLEGWRGELVGPVIAATFLCSETKKSYYANVCGHCNMFIGDNYLHEYYYERQIEKIDAGYKCFECIENEKMQIYLKEREEEEKETNRINHIISKAGDKR